MTRLTQVREVSKTYASIRHGWLGVTAVKSVYSSSEDLCMTPQHIVAILRGCDYAPYSKCSTAGSVQASELKKGCSRCKTSPTAINGP